MKIAVVGRTSYTKLLKFLKDFIIKQFQSNSSFSSEKFKDILISMNWGKSIWGENINVIYLKQIN